MLEGATEIKNKKGGAPINFWMKNKFEEKKFKDKEFLKMKYFCQMRILRRQTLKKFIEDDFFSIINLFLKSPI